MVSFFGAFFNLFFDFGGLFGFSTAGSLGPVGSTTGSLGPVGSNAGSLGPVG